MNAPIAYLPNFFDPRMFETIRPYIPWERRTETREECFMSTLKCGPVAYTYGKGSAGARTYASCPMDPVIEHMIEEMQKKFLPEQAKMLDFDLCFLNRYPDQHQHLGWHADDSQEIDQTAAIAIVSFGAAREIWLRPKGATGLERQSILLGNGSLMLMMPGMQADWQHRIPKHDRPCSERISLTYRKLAK